MTSITIKNETNCGRLFYTIGDGDWIKIEDQVHTTFIGKQRLHIFSVFVYSDSGFVYSDNGKLLHKVTTIVENIQSLSGCFQIKESERKKPKFLTNFVQNGESGDYDDEQFRRVGQVFSSRTCNLKFCGCKGTFNKHLFWHCVHLIRQGVLTSVQLNAILQEMF